MKGILTPEEKQYLKRVTNYLRSMGMSDGNIEIEMGDDESFDYEEINWNYVTRFANNYNADIPPGLIPILQKIMMYCDENGLIDEPNVDYVNYQRLEFDIDVESREITFSRLWSYNDRGNTNSTDYDSAEDIERFTEWEKEYFSNIEIPSDGILTATYNGSGDSGYMESNFEENNEEIPSTIENWCYAELSRNFGGWENNEGSDGNFVFDFNTKVVTLNYTDNIEENSTDTYFEEEFGG